ncbi:MAG: ATP-binding protein [Longimicrobiales bacterium]
MKDFLSRDEMTPDILPRAAAAALAQALESFPVVVVTGARQTGKSTLVQYLLRPERPYLTLDDPELRDQARRNPVDLLARAPELVLDEVQRAPDLLLAVKRAVDQDRPRRPGRYVLTGSANLLLMERISESLAGRASYLKLWPFTRRERLGLGTAGIWSELLATPVREWEALVRAQSLPEDDWRAATAEGGFPVPVYELDSPAARARWFDAYVDTYLERDLQTLARIDDLGDFRRLLRAAALRVGTVLNQADLARDVALSGPTAHRWLNLLETSFQIVRVNAFALNRTKRLVKSPKLYWSDVGLARHLAGGEARGAHLENLVLCDLIAWRELVAPRPDILHWRTVNQEEVDFVIEAGQKLLPVEIKTTVRPGPDDALHLIAFRSEYGERVSGALLLHAGSQVIWLAEGVLAAPWWLVM